MPLLGAASAPGISLWARLGGWPSTRSSTRPEVRCGLVVRRAGTREGRRHEVTGLLLEVTGLLLEAVIESESAAPAGATTGACP